MTNNLVIMKTKTSSGSSFMLQREPGQLSPQQVLVQVGQYQEQESEHLQKLEEVPAGIEPHHIADLSNNMCTLKKNIRQNVKNANQHNSERRNAA
jgi:hypothetical protein